MKTEIFQYNNNPITFQLGADDVMISATTMAKPFKKRVNDWINLPSTKEFLVILKPTIKSGRLVETVKGKGTWMHEDVAIEFARWLSPAFAIWCNARIKELLKVGMTVMPETLEQLITSPELVIGLAQQLKTERAKKELLAEQNRLQTEQLQISAPKVEFYDKVMQSTSTYSTNKIAKELGMSARTLNKILEERDIQYKQGGQWLLKQKYQDKSYTKTHTHHFTQADGSVGTRTYTVWTETGRRWIHELLTPIKAK